MSPKPAADAAKSGSDAAKRASRRALLVDLQRKAEEYLDALCLELGLALKPDKAQALLLALRQDFVEVHNAALKNPLAMPEAKSELNALMD